MRTLLFVAGVVTTLLGFLAHARLGGTAEAASLFQGALTLGGGWVICALFSRVWTWHGIIGGGILALLGAARCAPALLALTRTPTAGTPFEAAAFGISTIVLVATTRSLLRERTRIALEKLREND
ncbi:hypothetical protein [Haloferula helveola]|uniref:hypothetical protein n=1 Tax=Haloferula helveola TaxID=490095 RepID=UPI0030B74130